MNVRFVDEGERWGLRPTFVNKRGEANSWTTGSVYESVPSDFIVEHLLRNACWLTEDEFGFRVYEIDICCGNRVQIRARKNEDGTWQVLEFGQNVSDDVPSYEEGE